MPSGYYECREWWCELWVFEGGCKEVAFEVVHTDQAGTSGCGQGLTVADTH
jgi:hypothetical protein